MHVSMAQLRETQRRGLYQQAMIDRYVSVTEADIDGYLATPGVAEVTRSDAASLLRSEGASELIPGMLTQLRSEPGVWVIDVNGFG